MARSAFTIATMLEALRAGPADLPRENIAYDPTRDRLGTGAFGVVYKASVNGVPVAIKVPKRQDWANDKEKQAFITEVTTMKSVNHPNIVMYVGCCTQPGKIMLIQERMVCDLETVLHRRENVPFELKRKFLLNGLSFPMKIELARDAALGIQYLHENLNMIHRDLKPANLMVDDNLKVKVADFGFSEVCCSGKRIQMKGTALYMAPEVWNLLECALPSDIYSFSIILWEIFTEEEPFPTYFTSDTFFRDIIEGRKRLDIPAFIINKYAKDKTDPSASVPMCPALVHLMRSCWDDLAPRRPKISQILTTLEEIKEEAQKEPTSRRFWTQNFVPSVSVSWSTFSQVFADTVHLPVETVAPLKKLFTVGDIVTLERFDIVMKTFGEAILPERSSIVQEMLSLMTKEWFVPQVATHEPSSKESNVIVQLNPLSPEKEPFTLSHKKDEKTVIQRLSFENASDRYSLASETSPTGVLRAPSLEQLIDNLKSCPAEVPALT